MHSAQVTGQTGQAGDKVRQSFDTAAGRYDQHAALEVEVGNRLLERASFQRHEPLRILDAGCGTGYFTAALKQQYRKAEVVGLDFSRPMSRRTRQRSSLLRPIRSICGDLRQLPLSGRSFDLIFCNLALQWSEDFGALFNDFRRVLRPNGLLLFSSLGLDSLREMKTSAEAVFENPSFRAFPDLHVLGDALVSAGFAEPVIDSEVITLQYGQFDRLVAELESTGAATHFDQWSILMEYRAELARAYPLLTGSKQFPVTWEIVYGAAFGPAEGQPIKSPAGDVATFSLEALRATRTKT